MSKFKVGDRVRITESEGYAGKDWQKGKTAIITNLLGSDLVAVDSDTPEGEKETENTGLSFSLSSLELISKRGRPTKPKPIKYVAFYDEHDVDPYKEFEDVKALRKWLKEAYKDEDIDNDSIKVWKDPKPVKVSFTTNVTLS